MVKTLVTAAKKPLPVQANHLVERVVDGELVLYDPKRQCVHALNPTAAFVWRNCDGQQGAEEVINSLADYYPDKLTEIERDVREILARFLDEGLIG
ncbi:MAG: PqqD family protein [Chloroflexota bacterium]|jgi:hypothetical protein